MKKQDGQEITSLGNNRFLSTWHGIPDSTLTLDFNPIINAYKLNGQYILLHWQAKPKNLRTWGVYDSLSKNYFSVGSDELAFPICQAKIVDVPETIIKTVPTAMILFENVSWVNGRIM